MPFALESCNWLPSPASMCAQLPSGSWPSLDNNSLRPIQTSVYLSPLLFTVNNQVTFCFCFIHQYLVSFVSTSLHYWAQSVRRVSVCKAHQGRCFLVGTVGVVCWIFQVMPMRPPAPCLLCIPHSREEVFSEVVCWEHLNSVHISVREHHILTQCNRSFFPGEYYLFGFADFNTFIDEWKICYRCPPKTHFPFCFSASCGFASASHLIVSLDPGTIPSHFLTWSLLQQGTLKKMEDTMRSTRLRIRIRVEQAVNEVIEFFLPFSSSSLFLNSCIFWKGFRSHTLLQKQ